MKYEHVVTLDFETYFSQEYSLKSKSLNTSSYIRHPEFKVQCVALKIDDQPAVWCRDRDVDRVVHAIDWSRSALLCHHTAFDGLILSHHFGIVPAYYLDTLSMARALHSNALGASLDTVASFYKLGNKMPDVLSKTKGVRDLPDDVMTSLGQYCALDVELCRMIYSKMSTGFPQAELDLIDMTVRMFCDPVLRINMERVEVALKQEQEERQAAISNSGVDLPTLSSSDKFAHALRSLGIDPPTKISPRTDKTTWAFSKTDLDFTVLKGHHEPRVRALIAGRLAAKSTIGESRAQRFLDAGRDGQRLPIYLNYFGAHTGRWSAGNKMNMQNLKRGGELRKSIIAPEGHVIVVADSAQIEARVLAWLADDKELLSLFANSEDVYKHMAAQIYSRPTSEITKDQRFIGKIAVLGLGYGMGWAKFKHTLATGAMGPAVDMSDDECQQIVRKYRLMRLPITKLWTSMELILYKMVLKREGTYSVLRHDAEGRIWLPNGLYLQYPFLTADYDEIRDMMTDYRYFDYVTGIRNRMLGRAPARDEGKKIYGGLLTENVVQALARIIISEQMLRISNRLKETDSPAEVRMVRRIVTMTHDEIVVCAPQDEGQAVLDMMIDEMRTPPDWCSSLPLNAEGGFDVNYSK